MKMRFKNHVRILFQSIIVITLFSYWAGFALLVVNKIFYKDLPGYTIGRICIWEVVAIIIAILFSQFLITKWGSLTLEKVGDEYKLAMNPKYGIYFVIYFLVAIIVGIWQFWIFSQKF